MRVRDREARLVRGVEGRRRDLADAAAEPVLQLAVDDHRRLEESLVRVALAGRVVEGELGSWGDVVVVDQMRHELDVVDPVRHAAVIGLVRTDETCDAHRLRVAGRALRRDGRDLELGSAIRRREQRRHQVAGRRLRVEHSAGLGGNDAHDVARPDREARVLRRMVDALPEVREEATCRGPGELDLGRAAARQLEQPRDLRAGEMPAAWAVDEVGRSRERRLDLHLGAGEILRREPRLVDLQRQGDRLAREARQCTDEDLLRRPAVEQAAVPAGDDFGVDPLEPERRLDPGPVEGARKAADIRADRGAVDPRRRHDLAAEDADTEPLQAAERAEAFALLVRRLDGRTPIDVDEDRVRLHLPAPPLGDEDNRRATELTRAPLEERASLGGRQSRDVDARDLRAGRQPLGGARIGEPEHGPGEQDDRENEQAPLPDEADPSSPTTPGPRKVSGPYGQVRQCSET